MKKEESEAILYFAYFAKQKTGYSTQKIQQRKNEMRERKKMVDR